MKTGSNEVLATTMRIRLHITIVTLLLSAIAPRLLLAQKSIGVEQQERPFDLQAEYVGKKFIILEQPDRKSRGLGEFKLDREVVKKRPDLVEIARTPAYKKFVSKVITGKEVIKHDVGSPTIVFHEPVNDVLLYTTSGSLPGYEKISGLAAFDDLEAAKAKWLNQTIYIKARHIGTYNAERNIFGKTSHKIRTPLKVIDVWWAVLQDSYYQPLWLIVETPDGTKGYVQTRVSWSNTPLDSRVGNPWDQYIYGKNPSLMFNWSEEVWNLVEMEKVSTGMTEEQVEMSWGRPDQKLQQTTAGKTHITWAYGSSLVIFENGKVIHTSGPTR